jgi:hypothetical protein
LVRPERKSTQLLCCGKCQRGLLFLRRTDTLLAVLKSAVMQGNKIKSGTWSCIAAAAAASGRPDSIPFLLKNQ